MPINKIQVGSILVMPEKKQWKIRDINDEGYCSIEISNNNGKTFEFNPKRGRVGKNLIEKFIKLGCKLK